MERSPPLQAGRVFLNHLGRRPQWLGHFEVANGIRKALCPPSLLPKTFALLAYAMKTNAAGNTFRADLLQNGALHWLRCGFRC